MKFIFSGLERDAFGDGKDLYPERAFLLLVCVVLASEREFVCILIRAAEERASHLDPVCLIAFVGSYRTHRFIRCFS